jgi:hypothetical protein
LDAFTAREDSRAEWDVKHRQRIRHGSPTVFDVALDVLEATRAPSSSTTFTRTYGR